MIIKIDGKENKDFMKDKNLFCKFLKENTHSGKVSPEVEIFKSVDMQKDSFHWVMSTFDTDRDFEKVDPSGWLLDNYLLNPVVLWSHDYKIPAIGYAENIKADKTLEGDIKFNSKDYDEFGWSIGERVRHGALRCGSVGFRVHEVEYIDDEKSDCNLIYRKQELMEFSICCVPSNPFALTNLLHEIGEGKEIKPDSYFGKMLKGLAQA